MLDVRVYRAAFLPALVALFVAAFSLDGPAGARSPSPLAADAFDAERAFGGARAARATRWPSWRARSRTAAPGSAGDARARRPRGARRSAASRPHARHRVRGRARARRATIETVIGVRPGPVEPPDRRARPPRRARAPGLAELSGTAALLELARMFRARELRQDARARLHLGRAPAGFAGARAWAEERRAGAVDAVIVLGDMAGARSAQAVGRAVVVESEPAPLGAPAHGRGARARARPARPGGAARAPSGSGGRCRSPSPSRAWSPRRACRPCSISASGERGPAPGDGGPPRPPRRVRARGAARGRRDRRRAGGATAARPFADEPDGIVTLRNVLPDWAVRLLVGTLLLPALLAALDAFFRVRRRRLPVAPWLVWLAAAALPLVLAWMWMRALGITGALDAARRARCSRSLPLERAGCDRARLGRARARCSAGSGSARCC